DVSYFPIQDVFNFFNVLFIVWQRLICLTRSFAIAYLVFEANLKRSFLNILGRKWQIAGSEGIRLLDKVEDGVHHSYRGIRTEVGGSVFNQFSCPVDARKWFFFDDNPWVGFIIL